MNSKKWTIGFFLLCGGGYLLCLPLFNIIIDPFAIYKRHYEGVEFEPNLNYIKIKHILNNKEKYDTFAFGSSRTGNINYQKYFGNKAYSLNHPEAVPSEHLQLLKILLAQGVKIKQVVIGVDDNSYHIDKVSHYQFHRTRLYPVSLLDKAIFHVFYLFRTPTHRDEAILMNRGYASFIHYDILDSGRTFCAMCEENIIEKREEHIKGFEFDISRATHGPYLSQEVEAMREIVALLKENNIELKVFINPLHKVTYLDLDLVQFNRFKRELASIVEFYDYSGINPVTVDNFLYKEASHYREVTGDLMLDVMVKGSFAEEGMMPQLGEFGVLINTHNVEAQLVGLVKQLDVFPGVKYKYQQSLAYHRYLRDQRQRDQSRNSEINLSEIKQGEINYSKPASLAASAGETFASCNIDMFGGGLFVNKMKFVVAPESKLTKVTGWMVEPGDAIDQIFFLRFYSDDAEVDIYVPAFRFLSRPDVVKAFNDSKSEYLGFEVGVPSALLRTGDYRIEVILVSQTNSAQANSGQLEKKHHVCLSKNELWLTNSQ